ncbi:hypothetical protein BDL97_16G016100 [Sphagnum fallax]|jgi:hypothetical protein|uniref:Uncharacterized protein n=1 Tax=Sphagnum jensenii TaxID=128206 RepID=A0ABP0WE89_9BRYO|nr:hypothetical protein BDL97_16G016100 [Sphagnum fallax]
MGLTSFGWSRPTASRRVQGRGSSGIKTSSAGVDGNVKTANSGVQGPGYGSRKMYDAGGIDNVTMARNAVQGRGYSCSKTYGAGENSNVLMPGSSSQGSGYSSSKSYGVGLHSNVVGANQPGHKFGTMSVATGKKMAIVRARLSEKLAHLGADLRHSLYCAMHPRVLRLVAKESNIAIKAVATERRRQKEAKAREVANKKRAMVRQQKAWHSQQQVYNF